MTGQILDLRSRGDIGAASDTAYAQLGYDAGVTLGAEICSGFRIALAANFNARGAAGVEFLDFIQATLELEAGAEIRAELAAQLSPDVTDVFGLHVVAAVQLKAYIRARLAVGVSLGDVIAQALRDRDGDLGLEDRLLLALVDQISFEMGIEASAELAISAAAIISARINLKPGKDREPGFDLQISAGAGFLYGKNVSVFMRGRLPTLTGYLDDAVSIVTDAIVARQDNAGAHILGAGLKSAGRAVVASMAAEDEDEDEDQDQDTTAILAELLDTVAVAALEALIETTLDEALSAMLGSITVVPTSLQEKTAALAEGGDIPDLAEVLSVLSEFAELGDVPAPGQDETLLARISAALHALVFVTNPAYPLFDLPLPTHVIRQAALPASASQFTSPAQAIAILDGGVLNENIARLPQPLDRVMHALIASLDDAGLGLGAYLAGQLPDVDSLQKLAGIFAERVITDVLVPDAERELTKLEASGELPPILADLIRSLLFGTAKLLLPVLSELAQETDSKKQDALRKKLAHYATQMAAMFLVQQISEIFAVFFKSSVRDFEQRIEQVRDTLNAPGSDFTARLVDPILGSLSEALPGDNLRRTPRRAEMLRIVKAFMLDLCDAAQIAFGSSTWSPARIDRLSGALLSLTTGADGEGIDWANQSSDDLRTQIDALADCPPLVGALKDAVDAVGQDLSEIGVAQAKVFLLHVPLIIARHLPDLARELVLAMGEEGLDVLGDLVADGLDWAQDRIDEAAEALERLAGELAAAIQAIEDAIEALQQATRAWANAQIDDLLANLDFSDANILERIVDAITSIFGATGAVIDGEQSARAELRSIKSALNTRLNDAAFADLRTAALRSRHLNTSDMAADHAAVLQSVYSDQERAALRAMPLKSGTDFEDAGRGKLGAMNAAVTRVQDDIVTFEAKHLQIESQTALRQAGVTKRQRHLDQTRDAAVAMRTARSIRFNAPLTTDPAPDIGQRPADLPLYGPLVHLEIDLGNFPVRLVDQALDVPFSDFAVDRFGQPATGAENMKSLVDRGIVRLDDAALYDIRLFVNGTEVALNALKKKGTRLSGTLPETLLQPGRNHVLLSVYSAPALSLGPPVVHHVAFLRDEKSFARPSNTVGFDRDATVINTRGDDHQDARAGRQADRETIVVHNRSDSASVELGDWEIEDANGHVFRFPPRTKLQHGERISIVVGPSSDPGQLTWVEDYGRGPIALLNNTAERLLLRTPQGRIVSQMFWGSAGSNADIHILNERAQP